MNVQNCQGSADILDTSALREYWFSARSTWYADLTPGFVGLAISWVIQIIALDSRETEYGTNLVQLVQAMIRLTVAKAHKLSRQTAYFPSRYISIFEAVCRANEPPQSTTIPTNFAEIAIGYFQIPGNEINEIGASETWARHRASWKNSEFWAMLVFGSGNAIVTAAHEEMQFHATLVFPRSKEFCFSTESIAFISLNSDHGPLEFVRMDYVTRIVESYWGHFGLAVLDLTTKFLSLSKGEEIATVKHFLQTGARVFLKLRGLPTGISFIAHATLVEWETLLGCLRWLLSTLSPDKPTALRARRFAPISASKTNTHLIKCAYSTQETAISDSECNAGSSTCWISLIEGANIGLYEGYSPANLGSPSRDWVGKGLRIPFSVLVQVAGIQEVVEIEGTPVLCGFRTALIPIALFDDGSVQWHFVAASDGPGDRFRWFPDQDEFLQAIPPDRLRNVPVNKLTGTAYVGGWASIRTVVGNTDPPNPIPRSHLPQQTSRQYVCSGVDLQAALQIAPGIPVSPFLGITQKLEFVGMRCRYTPEEDMCGMVDQLYSKQVILYDDLQKTAYLCRLISLVVSLVRAYLRDNGYEYDRKILEFETGVEKSQAEVRKLLPKHVDEAVNFKFEDVFKIVTKRYSAMNAILRPEIRCTKSAILGFEIADILDSNDLCARKLAVTNGVETWNPLAELIDVVFCGGYGDVILSSDGSPCPQLPPSGYNVLVCPLNLLKKHFDSVDGNCNKQRGRHKFVWESTGTEFECDVTKLGRNCDGWECLGHRLQRINAPRKLIKNHLKNPRKEQSVSFEGGGAIGFGSCVNLRRARSKAADDSKSTSAASLIRKVVSSEDLHDDVSCRIRITLASESCSVSSPTAST